MINILVAIIISHLGRLASINKVTWHNTIQGYRLTLSEREDQMMHTLTIRDRHNRLAARIRREYMSVPWQLDVIGDGVPEVVVNIDAGADGHADTLIFSMGKRIKNLIAFYSGRNEVVYQDLDGNGTLEMCTYDDGYRYALGSPSGWGPMPLLILGLKNGRYVDVTRNFPDRLEAHIVAARNKLDHEKRDGEVRLQWACDMYVDALVISKKRAQEVWVEVMKRLSPKDQKAFKEERAWMEKRLTDRSSCINYLRFGESYGEVLGAHRHRVRRHPSR